MKTFFYKTNTNTNTKTNTLSIDTMSKNLKRDSKENNVTILKVTRKIIVVSSMDSPSNLPHRPPTVSINSIQKMTNIESLRKLERMYDDFLDKNMQTLLLYNVMEDYLDIRDALTLRISKLKRENNMRFHANKYFLEE